MSKYKSQTIGRSTTDLNIGNWSGQHGYGYDQGTRRWDMYNPFGSAPAMGQPELDYGGPARRVNKMYGTTHADIAGHEGYTPGKYKTTWWSGSPIHDARRQDKLWTGKWAAQEPGAGQHGSARNVRREAIDFDAYNQDAQYQAWLNRPGGTQSKFTTLAEVDAANAWLAGAPSRRQQNIVDELKAQAEAERLEKEGFIKEFADAGHIDTSGAPFVIPGATGAGTPLGSGTPISAFPEQFQAEIQPAGGTARMQAATGATPGQFIDTSNQWNPAQRSVQDLAGTWSPASQKTVQGVAPVSTSAKRGTATSAFGRKPTTPTGSSVLKNLQLNI